MPLVSSFIHLEKKYEEKYGQAEKGKEKERKQKILTTRD